MKKLIFFSVFLIFLIAAVWGENYFWNGLIDNDWNNYENWYKGSPGTQADPGEYPGSTATNDTAEIGSGHTVVISSTIVNQLNSLTINGGNLILGTNIITVGTITNNGTLTLAGNAGQLPGHTSIGGTVEFTAGGTTFSGITDFNNLTIQGGARTGVGAVSVSGNFILSGGSLNAASLVVTGNSTISANVTTTGNTQTYNGNVTLDANVTLVGSTITLGAITGGNNSLTITGNAEFNDIGSGINALSVSGTASINANITTTGTQQYGAVTLGGTGTLHNLTGTNVTITGAVTGGNNSLTITGNASLNAVNGLTNLTVTGTATLNVNITTAGNQTYGTVNFPNAVTTLESTTGRIVIGNGGISAGTGNITLTAGLNIISGGPITAANLNASASGGISLTNTSNNVATVSFTNTGTGDISYTNARGGLTVTNAVNIAGKVSITESGSPGNLTIGTITSNTLSLTANGNVTLSNASNVTINDSTTTVGHIGTATVYIKANNLYETIGGFNFIFTNLSDAAAEKNRVCFDIENTINYSGLYHSHTTKHIVYSSIPEPNPPVGYDGLIPGDYQFRYAGNIDTELDFYTNGNANIYLINVDDSGGSEYASSRILNLGTEPGGRIEIRGYYKTISGGILNINSTGGVRLSNANVTLAGDFNTSGAPLTVAGTGGSEIYAENIILGGGIEWVSPHNLTLTANTIHITGTAGTTPLPLSTLTVTGELTLQNTTIAASSFDFNDTAIINGAVTLDGPVNLARNITITTSSGGTVKLGSVVGSAHTLTLGGGSLAAPLKIGHTTAGGSLNINSRIVIAANGHVALDQGSVEQPNGQNLELKNDAVLDTSAGTWHMGAAGASPPPNNFSAVNGTLTLGLNSKLMAHNLNLTGNAFTVANSGWATIGAKGDAEISNNVSFTGDYPRLIIEMDGTGTQTLTTHRRLGSLHVGANSHTIIVPDDPDKIEILGMVKISAVSAPAGLDAGGYNIVMYAGLSGTRDLTNYLHIGGNPIKYARWEVVNAMIPPPPFASTPNMNNYIFRQNPERKVSFQKDPADSSGYPIFFEIVGNTMWREFECYEPGAVVQFSRHPDQHTVLENFSIRGNGNGANNSNYVTITRLTESRNIDGVGVNYHDYPYLYDPLIMGPPPLTSNGASVGDLGGLALPVYFPPMNLKITEQAEQRKYWNINLISHLGQRPLENFGYVRIFFSHAYNQRIPIETSMMHLDAIPYYRASPREGYFNFDWIELRKILYSFTEDSDGNGRLDRIRVQANVRLNGDFSSFDVRVEGYEIDRTKGSFNGFERVGDNIKVVSGDFDNDSFYIYLKENPGIDGGNTPLWSVTRNGSLMDDVTKSSSVGDPSVDRNIKPFDTIPPRIAYSLTLPGHPQTYVRMSEPVVSSTGASVIDSFAPSLTYLNGARVVDATGSYTFTWQYFPFDAGPVNYTRGVPAAALGYLLYLKKTFEIDDLEELKNIYGDMTSIQDDGYFSIDDMVDQGQPAMDWSDSLLDPAFYIYYQPPKYPLNWGYTAYAKVFGNGHLAALGLSPFKDDAEGQGGVSIPLTDVFIPPHKLLTVEMMTKIADEDGDQVTPHSFKSYSNPSDPDTVIRRITDVLVSIPPDGISSENYFAWPVWARYSEPINTDEFIDPSGMFWGQQNTDTGIIWQFDGTLYLEPRFLDAGNSIQLQARINEKFLSYDLKIFWTTADIPSGYRNPVNTGMGRRAGGLWLPELINPKEQLHYYVSPLFGVNDDIAAVNNSPLFNYTFSLSDLNLGSGGSANFEFVFSIKDSSDLFIARLEAPRGVIPNNWYTLVRPFSFGVQNMRMQRGGVTVLNNVINSDARETAFVRYNLVRPGRVPIQVYTLDGTLVKSIRRNEYREAGEWTDAWDGTNNSGRAVARGMYFVRVVAPDIDEIRKIMVVR
jgi:hypothetical protein